MMKIKNPNFVDGEKALIDTWAAAMDSFLKGRAAGVEFVTIADLKAAFPAQAAQMSEGRIEAVCAKLGLSIVRDNA